MNSFWWEWRAGASAQSTVSWVCVERECGGDQNIANEIYIQVSRSLNSNGNSVWVMCQRTLNQTGTQSTLYTDSSATNIIIIFGSRDNPIIVNIVALFISFAFNVDGQWCKIIRTRNKFHTRRHQICSDFFFARSLLLFLRSPFSVS